MADGNLIIQSDVSPDFASILTPEALAFQVVEGDPPEGVQVLTVDFKGDGLLVGYPPGVEVPTWLQAPGSLTSSSRALIYVQVSAAGLARGSYATTLRLVTGKEDGSEFVVKDVPVTLQVRQGLVVGPEALDFTALEGFAPAAQALTLGSDLATERWSVAARGPAGQPADWVVLPVAGGSLSAGAGQVQVGVAPRTAGDHLATLVVRDEAGSVRAEVPLRYHVDALVAAGNEQLDELRTTLPDRMAELVDRMMSEAEAIITDRLAGMVAAAESVR